MKSSCVSTIACSHSGPHFSLTISGIVTIEYTKWVRYPLIICVYHERKTSLPSCDPSAKRKTSRVNFIRSTSVISGSRKQMKTHYSSGLTENMTVTIVGLWIWTTTIASIGGPMIFIQTAASDIMMKWVRILHHSRTFNRFILKSSRSSKFIALVVYCWVLEAIYEPQQVNAASRRLAFTSFSTDWPKSETSCGWLWGHYAVGSKFGRGGVAGASERRKSLRKLALETAKVSS